MIVLSSAGHHLSPIRWNDVMFSGGYDKWHAYGQSKTANALFAFHLDRLGRDRGIRAFSLHPGKIFTPLQRHLTRAEMIAEGWLDAQGAPVDPTFKTPAQGAATQVWAATSPLLDGLGGLYCEDCDVAVRAEVAGAPFVGVKAYAVDPDAAARLWALSVKLTETGFPEGSAVPVRDRAVRRYATFGGRSPLRSIWRCRCPKQLAALAIVARTSQALADNGGDDDGGRVTGRHPPDARTCSRLHVASI